MRALILLTGIASLCVMSNSAAQVVYKWIDADNVTHFSAQPPNGTDVERTTVKIRHTNRQALADRSKAAAAQNAAVTTRKQHEAEQAAENKTRAEKDRLIRADNCAKARTRLLTYNSARRLYRPLENGERKYLSDEELDNERAKAQKLVTDWCD